MRGCVLSSLKEISRSGGGAKTAVFDDLGSHTYRQLLSDSYQIASSLITNHNYYSNNNNNNVSILTPNNSHYVRALCGVWEAGKVGVPLCPAHPHQSLQYFINNSKSNLVLTTQKLKDKVRGDFKNILCM